MADKRTYREIVASIETSVRYIDNHLQNIDGHLEKINTTNLEQEIKIAQNKDRIKLGYRIGGGILTLLGATLITGLLGVW